MSLPRETIRQAILSPDPDLRWAAIAFFRRTHADDQSIMPLVMRAYEQYGMTVFDSYYFLEDIAQNADSIAWLRRQLDEVDLGTGEAAQKFLRGCINALCEVDPAALKPADTIIALCGRIDPEFQDSIAGRLALVDLGPDELWRRLTDLCAAADQGGLGNYDVVAIDAMVRALARHPAECREKVLELLARQEGDCLEAAMTELAGRLRLQEAAGYLIELLKDFDGWAYDDANFALADIGTDEVVRGLERLYLEDDEQHLEAANLLADIHSELSAATALKLLEGEQDEGLRLALARAALESYAPEAIEPARQVIIATPKTPDSLEVRDFLLLVCQMLDARIPEYDEWLADSAHDREFRRQWYQANGEIDIEAMMERGENALLEGESWSEDEFSDDESFDDDGSFEDEPFDDGDDVDRPIVRHEQHVGRNDPCPCGSGKKYKKCCLHKQPIE